MDAVISACRANGYEFARIKDLIQTPQQQTTGIPPVTTVGNQQTHTTIQHTTVQQTTIQQQTTSVQHTTIQQTTIQQQTTALQHTTSHIQTTGQEITTEQSEETTSSPYSEISSTAASLTNISLITLFFILCFQTIL